ncbi:MAG: bifunctional phosphoribosylaminoimidazolecarboxamide formyltransferase/IMP cyclohydrolase [Candidatus Woykebacteria bacterium]
MKNSKSALISVYKKTSQLITLAHKLKELGFRIYASGGTEKFLLGKDVEVVNVEKLTGFPPILDHRVVTLHPKIHAGILSKNTKEHEDELKILKVSKFDLVIVDLYPVWEGIKSGNLEKVLDMVDIGGPTMLRAAAKNFNNERIVVCDMSDTALVVSQLESNGQVDFEVRKKLAAKVFSLMEKYDGAIASFLSSDPDRLSVDKSDRTIALSFNQGKKLRYGENPHQKAWVYAGESNKDPLAIQKFKQLQGKELSFNNYLDIDAAISCLSEVGGAKPSCVIIKHTNPAGFSLKNSIEKAYEYAWYGGDPLAAFGGVVGVNRNVTKNLAKEMLLGKNKAKKFFEVLIAPSIDKEALQVFSERKDLRILVNPFLKNPKPAKNPDFKKIRGGILYQDADVRYIGEKDLKVVTKKKPTKREIKNLLFAWRVVKICKSNAICLVKDDVLIASGVGQQDRKESCKIAVAKATDPNRGKSKMTIIDSVAASDAFFPFPDGPEILIKAGVKAIIQPGGSIRDQETIDICKRNNVAMVFTSTRSFSH